MKGGGLRAPPAELGNGELSSSVCGDGGAVAVQPASSAREFRYRPLPGSAPRVTRGNRVKLLAKAFKVDKKALSANSSAKVSTYQRALIEAGEISEDDHSVDMDEKKVASGCSDLLIAPGNVSPESGEDILVATNMETDLHKDALVQIGSLPSFSPFVVSSSMGSAMLEADAVRFEQMDSDLKVGVSHLGSDSADIRDVNMMEDGLSASLLEPGVNSVPSTTNRSGSDICPPDACANAVKNNLLCMNQGAGPSQNLSAVGQQGEPKASSGVWDHCILNGNQAPQPPWGVTMDCAAPENHQHSSSSAQTPGWNKVNGSSQHAPSSSKIPNAWKKPSFFALPSKDEIGDCLLADNSIQLDKDILLVNSKKMESALVGRLFGRRLPFNILNAGLHARWDKFGSFRVMPVGNDCFICLFDSVEHREAVLLSGPWLITGQVLGIDRWHPDFTPESLTGFNTPVWVRLIGLPLYCWDANSIGRIACGLGNPLGIDAATQRMERTSFARVCICLDLSKNLKAGLWVNGLNGKFFQHVEYEGITQLCFNCGHVGHKLLQCSLPLQARFTDILQKPSSHPSSPLVNIPMNMEGTSTAGINLGDQGLEAALSNTSGAPADLLPKTASAQVVPPVFPECHLSSPSASKLSVEDEGYLGPWCVASYRRRKSAGAASGMNSNFQNRKQSLPKHPKEQGSKQDGKFQWKAKSTLHTQKGKSPFIFNASDGPGHNDSNSLLSSGKNSKHLHNLGAALSHALNVQLQPPTLRNNFSVLEEPPNPLDADAAEIERGKKRKQNGCNAGGDSSPLCTQ